MFTNKSEFINGGGCAFNRVKSALFCVLKVEMTLRVGKFANLVHCNFCNSSWLQGHL